MLVRMLNLSVVALKEFHSLYLWYQVCDASIGRADPSL